MHLHTTVFPFVQVCEAHNELFNKCATIIVEKNLNQVLGRFG